MRDKLVDQEVRALATAQGGVVSARQLQALGWDRRAVSRRVAAGRLRPIHRAVYVVGHDHLGAWGRYWAAVLACGGDGAAALSHWAAGSAWKLLPVGGGPIDVSVRVAGGRARRPGLRIHRRPELWPIDVTTRRGLPITTPERTLLDLAATTSARTVRQALTQADNHPDRILDHAAVTALATSGRPGAPALREALGLQVPESPLEDRFLAFCEKHGLPQPQTQVRLGPYRADFLWPEAMLIVEADSHAYHRRRFEEDRARDITLAAQGFLTLRVTKRSLTQETAERIHRVLSARLH